MIVITADDSEDFCVCLQKGKSLFKKDSKTHGEKWSSIMNLVFNYTTMTYHQTNKFRELAKDEWETQRREKKKAQGTYFQVNLW